MPAGLLWLLPMGQSKAIKQNWTGPTNFTAQKMKFSIKDFFSKCGQIRSFLRIWLHLQEKSLMENFIFCAVLYQFLRTIFSC